MTKEQFPSSTVSCMENAIDLALERLASLVNLVSIISTFERPCRLRANLGIHFRFRLRLLFCFLILLLPFLLLCQLLLVLPLHRRLLLLSLPHRLEEAFQPCLLCCLHVSLQLLTAISDSILIKAFLSNQKSDETFDIRCIPCEVACVVICRMYIWVEE